MDLVYERLNANMHTPLAVYKGLNAKFLLESASLESAKGRYSILVRNINFSLQKIQQDSATFYMFQEVTSNNSQQNLYNLTALQNYENLPKILQSLQQHLCTTQELDVLSFQTIDFFSLANLLRESYPQIPQELMSLPLPLGGLGYVSYEFFSECESMLFTKKPLYEAPEAMLIFPQECIIFDHFYDEMYLVVSSYEGSTLDCKKQLECLKQDILNLQHTQTQKFSTKAQQLESKIIYEDSKEWYEKHVSIIKDEIYKGTFLQCVLSRAIAIQSNMNPLYFYETLRRNNPSPYMYFLDFDDFKIIGASPEVMVQCKEGIQMLRPIAGTRKRGKNLHEDNELAKDLLNDEKENAEHLMLVDLGRNDIGRNAKIGSVKLDSYRIIEKYSSVMHIVSQVSGEILDGKTSSDCFKACFPAGTVSGAPKIEAIKKLAIYEQHARSIYSGAILYFTRQGDLDSAITLRSSVFKDNIYYLQAGAGIVMDSIPENEFIETCNKMKALCDILL